MGRPGLAARRARVRRRPSGCRVWHVPWTDKNDGVDWQAYFHHRNRFIAALLHSPYPARRPTGAREPRPPDRAPRCRCRILPPSRSTTGAARRARRPHALHGQAPAGRGGRHVTQTFTDAGTTPTRSRRTPHQAAAQGQGSRRGIPGRLSRHDDGRLRADPSAPTRGRRLSEDAPEASAPGDRRQVVRLADYDSAIVSMIDSGLGGALTGATPPTTARCLRRPWRSRPAAPRVRAAPGRRYRAALGDITSPEAWEKTLSPWRAGDDRSRRAMTDTMDRPAPGPPPDGRTTRPAAPRPGRRAGVAFPARRRPRILKHRYLSGLVRREVTTRYTGSIPRTPVVPTSSADVSSCTCPYFRRLLMGRRATSANFAIHVFAALMVVSLFTRRRSRPAPARCGAPTPR